MIPLTENILELIKLWRRFGKNIYWESCKQDVEEWCKSNRQKKVSFTNLKCFPFERVQMDVLGPLPLTVSGNKYLLVVVDYFTK